MAPYSLEIAYCVACFRSFICITARKGGPGGGHGHMGPEPPIGSSQVSSWWVTRCGCGCGVLQPTSVRCGAWPPRPWPFHANVNCEWQRLLERVLLGHVPRDVLANVPHAAGRLVRPWPSRPSIRV